MESPCRKCKTRGRWGKSGPLAPGIRTRGPLTNICASPPSTGSGERELCYLFVLPVFYQDTMQKLWSGCGDFAKCGHRDGSKIGEQSAARHVESGRPLGMLCALSDL